MILRFKGTSSILLAVVSLAAALAFAGEPSHQARSAVRQRGVSYTQYMRRVALPQTLPGQSSAKSVMDSAQVFGRAQFPPVQAWATLEILSANFAHVRDARWMSDASHPDFLRRSTWLFPDDGCYARAALAVSNLIKWQEPAPNKAFVFGDLSVATPNTPDGMVYWWYHVAPVVSVAGVRYVLDPAVDPLRPLRLEEWLARMSPYPNVLRVAVCGSGAYAPDDVCLRDSTGREDMADVDQRLFFDDEWWRLIDLGRDPLKELGEEPPWMN